MTALTDPPPHAPAGPTRDAATARLLATLDARVPGRPLPAPLYTDPDLHAVDLALLWSRQWVFVGTSAEIAEPGDYLTVDLGPSSVLVLRDDEEQPRAFHNVCRHRGARLVTEERGPPACGRGAGPGAPAHRASPVRHVRTMIRRGTGEQPEIALALRELARVAEIVAG